MLAFTVLAIYLEMGRPVFFRQLRPGLHGKLFNLCKFRTMREAYGEDGRLLPDAERLTRAGRIIRSLSLDELPQLWNVLKGEMSLVGPRPLLPKYLERYTTREARRHEVRPGITGWAQINGRQTIPFSKRLELDVWYVENWSFWLDIKIIFLTVPNVCRSRGVILGQEVQEIDDRGLATVTDNHEPS